MTTQSVLAVGAWIIHERELNLNVLDPTFC